MTDGMTNFMYSKQDRDNAKLRIFSFILQQQRIQPNFMNDTIRNFTHSKQLNTRTTQKTKTTTSTCIYFTSNTKFMLLQLRQCKFFSIYIQTLQKIGWSHTFHPSQILYISLTPKNLYLACWPILYISSICTWICYSWCGFLLVLLIGYYTHKQRHKVHTGVNRLTHPYEYILTPPVMCLQHLFVLH